MGSVGDQGGKGWSVHLPREQSRTRLLLPKRKLLPIFTPCQSFPCTLLSEEEPGLLSWLRMICSYSPLQCGAYEKHLPTLGSSGFFGELSAISILYAGPQQRSFGLNYTYVPDELIWVYTAPACTLAKDDRILPFRSSVMPWILYPAFYSS